MPTDREEGRDASTDGSATLVGRRRGDAGGVTDDADDEEGSRSDDVPRVEPVPAPQEGIGMNSLQADDSGSYDSAVNEAIQALFNLTRTVEAAVGENGQPLPPSAFNYASLATNVRAVYETLNDVHRATPIVQVRRGAKTGLFDTPRLRELLRFVLRIGGAGLTYRELRYLYDFLDVWCGTKPGVSSGDDDTASLRAAFPSANAFIRGVKDELDSAVVGDGWRKVLLTEGGMTYEAYFRPVLDVIIDLMKRPGVRLWSGESGPAPPTDRRQSPMDGDAFRMCEQDVVQNNGASSFVIGVHAYSDGSRISWSGGKIFWALAP